MTEITAEHIRVFKDVRDKGCVVNYYFRYPTPYYGDGQTEMPRKDWYLLSRLVREVDKCLPGGYTFRSDESEYLTWTDATVRFTDLAEVTGTFREWKLTSAALELLND